MGKTKPTRKDLRGSSEPPSLEQHLKELLYEAVGWLVEYECTGRFDDRARGMLRDMIDRCDAAVGRTPDDWAEVDRLAQANAKPPNLKEQALEELEQLRGDAYSMGMGFDAPAIRRALEQLDD